MKDLRKKKADRKEVSDLNMPLGSFVTGYDPQFKRDFMSLYPNGANDIEQNIVFFDDNSKTLDYAPKVYINVHELAGDNFDVYWRYIGQMPRQSSASSYQDHMKISVMTLS